MKNKAAGSVSKYFTPSGERLWRFRFDADSLEGKRQQIGKAGFSTRGEANDELTKAIEAYKAKKMIAPAPPAPKETIADWVRTWLRDYAPQRCTPKTIERYYQLAGYVLNATDGEPARLAATPLDEANHIIVESALYALLRMKARRREHLSSKTVREIAGVLSVSLNKAFRLGKIDINPLLRVELPRVERSEPRSLSPEEIQKLRDACHGDWTFTFVEISLATGARRGELLALTWADISWMDGKVTISKSLEETKAGLRVKCPKSRKVRKFKIGPSAITALRFQEQQVAEHRRLCGAEYKDAGLVFCEPDGSYLRPHLVSQTIVRRMQKAGIPDASLHTLRHTLASFLLSKNVPLPAVSARLGHADVNITAKIYSHALPDDDARAADAWEDVSTGFVQ